MVTELAVVTGWAWVDELRAVKNGVLALSSMSADWQISGEETAAMLPIAITAQVENADAPPGDYAGLVLPGIHLG